MSVITGPHADVGETLTLPGRRLTSALLVVASLAAGATLAFPDELRGTAAMDGSARVTAIVVLVAAVPLVVLATLGAAAGSRRAVPLRLGGVAYLAYNGVMFCFATPFNRLFLLYAGLLALAVWTLVVLLRDTAPVAADGAVPRRAVGAYILAVVVLNALAWLGQIVPALLADEPGEMLDGTGLPVNPVHVQDLTFWLPAMAVSAVLLWRAHPKGLLLAASGLVFWQIEALGVAVDQWFGHRADPASTVASTGAVWLFAATFLVGLLPAWALLRRIRR